MAKEIMMMTAEEAGEGRDKITTHHTAPQDHPAAFFIVSIEQFAGKRCHLLKR